MQNQRVKNIIELLTEDEKKNNLRKDFQLKETKSELKPIPAGLFEKPSFSVCDVEACKELYPIPYGMFNERKKMKLVDLIKKLRVINPNLEKLTPVMLRALKDDLQACDEFKDSEIIIVDQPFQADKQLNAYKVRDNTKFGGETYLYSIDLTPVMYNPTCTDNPVKDNCSITPVLYNPKNFSPYRKIQIFYSPEMRHDFYGLGFERDFHKIMHEQLDAIFNNPKDYEVKGFRSIVVRCLPDRYSSSVIENGEKVLGCNNNDDDNQIIPE